MVKFMFSKKATKIDQIFTIDLTFTISKCQIDGEDFSNLTNQKAVHNFKFLLIFMQSTRLTKVSFALLIKTSKAFSFIA